MFSIARFFFQSVDNVHTLTPSEISILLPFYSYWVLI